MIAGKHWVPLRRGRKVWLRVMSCGGKCECEAYLFCEIVGTCIGSARRAGFVVGTVGGEGETALPGGIEDYETYVSFRLLSHETPFEGDKCIWCTNSLKLELGHLWALRR